MAKRVSDVRPLPEGRTDRWHPRDGDSKPCPQCHQVLVFSDHYPVLTVGMAFHATGSDRGDRIRYEHAWVCRNGACDYREFVVDT